MHAILDHSRQAAAWLAASRTRTTLFFLAAFTLYWPPTLGLDTVAGLGQQLLLGLNTALFLVLALRLSPPAERVQVVSMVVVATGFECLASLVLGAYRYRLDNLPLFVPPGHGLFFLAAVRLASLPWIIRHARFVVWGVLVGSTGLAIRGLTLSPAPDLFGLGTWLVLLPFLVRSRYPVLYAVSFALTMVLEFYGTAVGNWAWVPVSPILGLPAGNPPAAIGAGYCIMDGLARVLAPHLDRARRFRATATGRTSSAPAGEP